MDNDRDSDTDSKKNSNRDGSQATQAPRIPDTQQAMRVPSRVRMPSAGNWTLGGLLMRSRVHMKEEKLEHPGEYLLGYRLPGWQRPAVWTQQQQERFIDSWYCGMDIGRFVVTQAEGEAFWGPLDNLLIDGQQRLRTIDAYLSGRLTYRGLRWDELTDIEQRSFARTPIPMVVISPDEVDEQFLREIYVRLNYGGTPHAPEHHPDVLAPTGALTPEDKRASTEPTSTEPEVLP